MYLWQVEIETTPTLCYAMQELDKASYFSSILCTYPRYLQLMSVTNARDN